MLTKKPASGWLDRLRFSKGIPATNDLDLEQFLSQNPNSDSISLPISAQIQSKSISNHNRTTESEDESRKEEKWFSSMSTVLAELFVMEDPTNSHPITHKKSSRKQPNPKACIFSSSASVDGNGDGRTVMSPSSVDNSVAEVKEDNEKLDLSGYSRSDLMIIDSSSVVWKTEKLVIRKGSVWKVRERKMKSRCLSLLRKKRKLKQLDDESEEEKKKKRRKKKKQKFSVNHSLSLSRNKADGDEFGGFAFKGFPENDNQVANKRTQPNLNQAPAKRCKSFRSLGRPAKKRSVYQMQNSPTGKKNIVHLP